MLFKKLLLQEEGQIVRHIVVIGVVVAALVLVLAEAGPIIWLRISSVEDAEDVANAAAFQYKMFNKEDDAISEVAAKMQMMGYSDEEIKESSVVFYPIGANQKTTVKVTVVRYAKTLITRHIKALKKFARVATSKEASVATATGEQ